LFLLLVSVCACAYLAAAAPTARAQEEGDKQQTDKSESGDGKEEHGTPNMFWHIISSAGPFFGTVLGLVSLGLVALIVILMMDLRMSLAIPPGFVDQFTEVVNRRQFKQAFDLCRSDNSFLARVLTAGMGRLQYGIEDAREAAINTVDSIRASKEQLINYLATIGTLGPMLGLVGTVFGMILSFMELSRGGAPRPEKLADGISHALVVTLIGIALAVPAIFCNAFFRNRLTRITMDTSNLADDLLTQMYHNSKKPAATAPTASTATAAAAPAPAARAVTPANTAAIRPAE
jgi:biopolymer transport protein ExbB